ncbi:cuticle protein 21-like [Oratosquilla oratoria]|uniref:cuticle protein 21-like n=1 Tax=Oratosquilla oratoria TaxID=337810 RepID=UPI003F764931
MNTKILIFLALVALAVADDDPGYSYSAPQQESSEEDYEPAKYEFTWAVKDEESGNDFGQQEVRDDERTEGSHYVQLPDGRLQKVTYYVDGGSGFVAEVTYEGEAHYPEPESSEETIYTSPPPPPPSPPQTLYETP